MTAPRTKAKPIVRHSLMPTKVMLESDSLRLTQKQQFSLVVGKIAKRYGVKVASRVAPTKNPYAMSPEQAVKVAVEAGILTPAGNLKRAYK